ncbi:fibronectin type III domain-containing protein [Paenibacillus sp. LHD-117]|uniref:RCC1 domain-containing protein n=1 Tax=Paenibacillus sp. LHD-117 TaxID=3071412 RepID=UPI0027DF3526|nr:fibronectin type III domain-containing protein [Paenibacillus sp. LHD-117]MDQ6423101.1 fibronectin type III domain-containing protein [Paenibacillus sp. LHD-117]
MNMKKTIVMCILTALLVQLTFIPGMAQAQSATNYPSVAAGYYHTLFLMPDGKVRGVGLNNLTQVGNGSTNTASSPVEINLTRIRQITASKYYSSYAVNESGEVFVWGYNSNGELGTGNTSQYSVPTKNTNLSNVMQVAAGDNFAVALMKDGTLKAWGNNGVGQLGNGTYSNSLTPVTIPGISDVKKIAAGSNYVAALLNNGTVKTWGYNQYGQLGLGHTNTVSSPTVVPGLTNVKDIAAGSQYALAIMNDGTVKAWGINANGQLGIGSTAQQLSPVNISGLDNVSQISAGSSHTLAVLNDGKVKVWGNNYSYQLGLASQGNYTSPIELKIDNILYAATGYDYSFLISRDYSIRGMGSNSNFQLGLGDSSPRTTPTLINMQVMTIPIQATGYIGQNFIATGPNSNSTFIYSNGVMKVTGSNSSGQLGLGDSIGRNTPTTISDLTGIKQLVAGTSHTLTLMEDGTVKAWGSSSSGGLGLGNTTSRNIPTTIAGLTGVKQLTAGSSSSHTLALMEDGSVKAWGSNSYGQLGLGLEDTSDRNIPTTILGLTGVKQIAAGSYYTLALMEDGTVKAWGNNVSGQLGLGDTTSRSIPVTITGLTGVKQLSAGNSHMMALMEDGTIKAWGSNSSGQLGLGDTTSRNTPTTIAGLTGVKQLAAGSSQTLALMEDGTVKVWGSNSFGQLGLGNTTNRSIPTTISGLTKVKQLAAGASHTVALMEDGTIKAWGSNSSGQLGLGGTTAIKNIPTAISSLTGVKQIVAGSYYTLALMNEGTVKAWGSNSSGELGLGDTFTRYILTHIAGLSEVRQLAARSNHALALMQNGTIKTWGVNSYGQLGLGDTTSRYTPTSISGLAGVKQIVAGSSYTLALMEDGTTKTWGLNSSGQLGLGDAISRNIPTTITGLTGVKQLTAGDSHTLALMEDGTVKAWGANSSGQLGLGNTTSRNIPTTIAGLTGVKQLSAGNSHTLALMEDGTVKAWGSNSSGQLGLGDTNNRNIPTTIAGLTGVKQITAGFYYTLALMENGTIKVWGSNYEGQLGLGDISSRIIPTTLASLTGVMQLAAGNLHTLVLMEDGTLKGWGLNTSGQLGLGHSKYAYEPTNLMMIHNTPGLVLSGLPDTTVTARIFLDSGTEPLETKNVRLSQESSYVNFESLYTSALSQGTHKLVFEVTDGVQLVRKEVPFEVTNALPTIDSFNITSDTNSITAIGSSASGALDPSPYRFIFDESDSGWMTGSPAATYTLNGLQPNTKYPVEFQVKNANGQITTQKKDAFTLAAAPTLASSGITPTSATFTVSDSNPSDTSYQITVGNKFVSTDGTLTMQPVWISIPAKKITVKGLQSGTNYKFQIKARNKEGIETAISAAVQAGPPIKPPTIPAGLKAVPLTNQIELSWKPVLEATSYQLETDGSIVEVGIQLSYIHNNLTPSTSHLYRVRAVRDGVPGEWSEPLSTKTLMPAPVTPASVTVSSTAKSVTIQWSGVTNVLSYELEWDGQLYRVGREATVYTFRDLLPGSQHSYRVRAINTGGPGPWSSLRTVLTLLTAPAAPAGITGSASDTTVHLNWQRVEDATYYEIMANGVVFYNGSANFASLGGLQPNTTYQYSVRAWNELGSSTWSNSLSLTTFALATPKLTKEYADDTELSLKWGAVTGASSYELERNGVLQQVSGINVIQEGLQPETVYTYRIRAKGSNGSSAWSSEMKLTTLPAKPVAPVGIYAVAGKDYITLSWENVVGASGYQVEIDGKVIMDNFNATSYSDELLDPFTAHTYRIRAVTDAVQGDWTTAIAMRTLPEVPKAPEGITLSSSGNLVQLSWAEEPSAVRYELEINGAVKDAGLQTSYTHRRVAAGSENRYRIRTINEAGIGAWSNLIVNNTINAKLTKGKLVDLNLTASDITDFSKYTLMISYDANAMKVTDLSSLTGKPELTTGRIEGTDITIMQFTPGRITFVTDKPIESGQSWTGVINSIKFQGLASGGSSITYTVVQQS